MNDERTRVVLDKVADTLGTQAKVLVGMKTIQALHKEELDQAVERIAKLEAQVAALTNTN